MIKIAIVKKEIIPNIINHKRNISLSSLKLNKGTNNNILNILNIKGQNIDNEIHLRINELEKINYKQENNIQEINERLKYIQNNIGVYKNTQEDELNRRLINMPIGKIYEILNKKTNEEELMIILSHLSFRKGLTSLIFSKILMKLGINNVRKIHEKINLNANYIISDWENNIKSRIICGLALSARYKMLKDYDNVKLILKSEFNEIWIKNHLILNNIDFQNLINITNGMIIDGYLITRIIETNNVNLIYLYWEKNSNNGIIREWLENNGNKCKLNKYQEFIFNIFNECEIEIRSKIVYLSKKFKLGLLNENQINKEKFLIFSEVMINEMEDERVNRIFNEFKGKIENDNVKDEEIVIHHNDSKIGVL